MRKNIYALICLVLFGSGFLQAQQTPQLDTTSFLVLGEGLAAGMADFSLREVYQQNSFPALMAQQMATAFPQPLIQAPGIGDVIGFPQLPVLVPNVTQTTVRSLFPPTLFVFNLAVPGHELTDAINLRPRPPLVQNNNPKQTITNLLLGYPAMYLDPTYPLWTQMEYAVAMNPTLVLVELGYTEALEAAVAGNAALMPDAAAFQANYAKLLAALRSNYAQVVTTTICDPFDTAYFSTASAAAALTGTTAGALTAKYGLNPGDYLTPTALSAIGVQAATLPPGSVVSAAAAAPVRAQVRALNAAITTASQQQSAILYDLNSFFSRVRASGVVVGSQTLTADYLGGFYSLSGSYPGFTGHALIANEILALLNRTFGKSFAAVNVANIAKSDPAVRFRPTGLDPQAQPSALPPGDPWRMGAITAGGQAQ
jgi:hypothetical protein